MDILGSILLWSGEVAAQGAVGSLRPSPSGQTDGCVALNGQPVRDASFFLRTNDCLDRQGKAESQATWLNSRFCHVKKSLRTSFYFRPVPISNTRFYVLLPTVFPMIGKGHLSRSEKRFLCEKLNYTQHQIIITSVSQTPSTYK